MLYPLLRQGLSFDNAFPVRQRDKIGPFRTANEHGIPARKSRTGRTNRNIGEFCRQVPAIVTARIDIGFDLIQGNGLDVRIFSK